jgi:hypothetical protein
MPHSSTPGHHSEAVVIGDIADIYKWPTGKITALILLVQVEAKESLIPVLPAKAGLPHTLTKGMRLWVRGRLESHSLTYRQSLVCLMADHLEVVHRPTGMDASPRIDPGCKTAS